MAPYKSSPVECDVDFDISKVKNRTVVITGGSNGIGEAYVRSIVKAGGYVVFGDIDEKGGSALASELSSHVRFFRCDVTKWADQLALFKEGIAFSPSGEINAVIANAGVAPKDSVHETDVSKEEPEEPALTSTFINLIGVLYTVKLALHYFRRQVVQNKNIDQVLILGGSLAGYLDIPGSLEYGGAKSALRGIMRNLRHTAPKDNIRVAFIGPWFIETKILSSEMVEYLKHNDAQFATVEDAATAVMRILSDSEISGRTFGILPRNLAPRGFVDMDSDDPPVDTLLGKLQNILHGNLKAE